MTPLAFALAFVLALGQLAFCAWCIYVYVTSDVSPASNWTTLLVWYTGRGLIWVAALLLAGGLFGLAAGAVWRTANQ
jgi:hypothetical protein